MATLTVTHPIWAVFGGWFHRFASGRVLAERSSFIGPNELGVALFLLLLAAAAGAAAASTPRLPLAARDAATALTSLIAWIVFAAKGPALIAGDALGIEKRPRPPCSCSPLRCVSPRSCCPGSSSRRLRSTRPRGRG